MTSESVRDPFAAEMERVLEFDCESFHIADLWVEQCWHVNVSCLHGVWEGRSRGPLDLWRALSNALSEAEEYHTAFYGKEPS